MNPQNATEIYNERVLPFPVELVYEACSNPSLLAQWWGPEGFTNTIHAFDLQPGGKWKLTMHGPEVGNYENESVFRIVKPLELIAWSRISQPLFDMEIGFEKLDETSTRFSFRMLFETTELCAKIRPFAEPKNEENFDRLERLLGGMV